MLFVALAAAIALRILIPHWRKQPPNAAAALAVKRLGITPSGADGGFTRLDHLKGAALSVLVAAVLFGVASGATWVVDGGHFGVAGHNLGSGVMFIAAIGAVMALAWAGVALVKAALGVRGAPTAGAALPPELFPPARLRADEDRL